MQVDAPNPANIYWYFMNLEQTFQDDPAAFEQNWRAIQNCGFTQDQLADVLKACSRFLTNRNRGRTAPEKRAVALECIQSNISCWEIPAQAILTAGPIPSLYFLISVGGALDHLVAPTSIAFVKAWQKQFFKNLKTDTIDGRFIPGLKCLAGFKNINRVQADIRNKDKVRILTIIETCADDLNANEVVNVIHALNRLHIVPSDELTQKLLQRAATIAERQIQKEKAGIPIIRGQKFSSWAVSQLIFSSADMALAWPDELFEPLTNLALRHIQNIGEAARALHGAAMLHAATRDKRYKDFGAKLYEQHLKDRDLSDNEKRQVFDSCLWFGFECDIVRPPEDHAGSRAESALKDYFNKIGIPTSDEPFIIQGTGHQVDIPLLQEEGRKLVAIEFDGPSHFYIYFDHKKPEKSHRIYNGRTLLQMALAHQQAPNTVIIHVPHSADSLGNMEGSDTKEFYIKRIIKRARGDQQERDNPAGVYILHAVKDRRVVLKNTKPSEEGGPMRTHRELHL